MSSIIHPKNPLYDGEFDLVKWKTLSGLWFGVDDAWEKAEMIWVGRDGEWVPHIDISHSDAIVHTYATNASHCNATPPPPLPTYLVTCQVQVSGQTKSIQVEWSKNGVVQTTSNQNPNGATGIYTPSISALESSWFPSGVGSGPVTISGQMRSLALDGTTWSDWVNAGSVDVQWLACGRPE